MIKKAAKPLAGKSRRKPRTDSLRNHERILEAAKEAFTRSGASASLDDIARQAGVGPGTLYRHFPTRDALIEAVYRSEVEKLAAAGRTFSETLPPSRRCVPGCCYSSTTWPQSRSSPPP